MKKKIIAGLIAIFVVVLLGGGLVTSLMSQLQDILSARNHVSQVHDAVNDLQIVVFNTIQQIDQSRDDQQILNKMIDKMGLIQDSLDGMQGEITSGTFASYGCGNCHDNAESLAGDIGELVYRMEDAFGDLSIVASLSITRSKGGDAEVIADEIVITMDKIHSQTLALHDLINPMLDHIDNEVETNIKNIKRAHDITIIITTLLVLMGIILLLTAIAKPIRQLSRGTEAIVKGDYDFRIQMEGRDEVAILAERFNYMAEVLSNREKRLHQNKIELEEFNESLEQKIRERTSALRGKQEEVNHKYLELESANEELQSSYIQLQTTAAELEEAQRRLQDNYDIVKNMNEELQRANEVKNKFLSIMSHELRTPLTVINGYLSLVLEKNFGNPSSELRDILMVVKEQGMNQLGLIEDLLDLTRIESGEFRLYRQSISPVDLINKIVDNFKPRSEEKKISIVVEKDEDLPVVYWDFQKMMQVIQNLVDNALKFTPAGGQIKLTFHAKSDFMEIRVIDNGIGIPKEQLNHIFDRFFQVDSSSTRRFGGSGLGLSIVREIVRAHNGKVFVESASGKGTTFLMLIPPGEPEKQQAVGSDDDRGVLVLDSGPLGKGETILVVDDDESFLKMMRFVLPRDGYKIHTTSHPSNAIKYARKYDVDLVMMDLMMPDIDGYEVCRRIRKDKKIGNVPIMVVSAAGGEEVSRRVYEAGADEHVTKPFEQSDFLNRIDFLLNNKRTAKKGSPDDEGTADKITPEES